MAEAKALKQRQSLKQIISSSKLATLAFPPNIAAHFLHKTLQFCEKKSAELDAIQKIIIDHADDDDEVKLCTEEYLEIVADLDETEMFCRQVLHDQGKAATPPSTSSTATPAAVRLPKTELPTFDGKYEEWLSFRDMFTTTITDHPTLGGVQKLQYLRSCLKGEPERMIRSISITEANFVQAWGLIKDRYEHQRELVFSILKTLLHQNQVKMQTATNLRKLLDTTNECIRSLNSLRIKTDEWDPIISFNLVDKLDADTKREWSKSLTSQDIPKFKDICSFLENFIRSIQLNDGSKPSSSQPRGADKKKTHVAVKERVFSCAHCNENHPIYKCDSFINLDVSDRKDFINQKNLCLNCFGSGHGAKGCKSKFTCRHCQARHHTLLHPDKKKESSPPPQQQSQQQESSTTKSSHFCSSSHVLLSTAMVNVLSSAGELILCRVFLDGGSEASYITDACSAKLGLKRRKCNVRITGLSSSEVATAKGEVTLCISSLVSSHKVHARAYVIDKVTGTLPSFELERHDFDHLKGIQLADPQFYEPREVDILLGADIHASLMLDGRISGSSSTPYAENTKLGWVLSGLVNGSNSSFITIQTHHAKPGIDEIISRFWEVESIPRQPNLTPEEQYCEEIFLLKHSRTREGRYVVPIPYKDNIGQLGASRDKALKRFLSMERRLERYPKQKAQYHAFIREYMDLRHMEIVPEEEMGEVIGITHFIPHHCVLKEESTTTKLRVVFDGSAETDTGISINQCIAVGQKLQDDLFDHLLRFRLHPITLKGDMVKFYRQFLLYKSDSDRHRILWRFNNNEPIREYRLLTVTYGMTYASHSSIRAFHQLIFDEGKQFPHAAEVALRDFHVDDLLSGGKDDPEVITIYDELIQLLRKGCLELRKFDSNSDRVISHIPEHSRERSVTTIDDKSHIHKALGIRWDSINDNLLFAGYSLKVYPTTTKRNVLSEMSKIFDPLGWLGASTITIKIYFQTLWTEEVDDRKLDWDDVIPHHLQEPWLDYISESAYINQVVLPRCVLPSSNTKVELHAFSDASEKGYGAVVYFRVFNNNGIDTFLIASKTKVAPIQQLSIPRMELQGALLLSELVTCIMQSANINCEIYAWTDSQIVLHWLTSSKKFKTFVANRISLINNAIPVSSWNHVPGEENPADHASRGIAFSSLLECELWWKGPPWLRGPVLPIHSKDESIKFDKSQLEVKATHVAKVSAPQEEKQKYIYDDFSCYKRLKRACARAMRFVRNLGASRLKIPIQTGPLLPLELNEALFHLVGIAQKADFEEEIKALTSSKKLPSSSPILSLNPFLDMNGIMRVGGRLSKRQDLESRKHPIILFGWNRLTKLIIDYTHVKNHHAPFQLLWSTLQQQFWIYRGRNPIKSIIKGCKFCEKLKARTAEQLMGQLPTDRITESRPFRVVGVDYAGPFTLLPVKGRGKTTIKVYLCVFVCFSVKAVHLEVAYDLTTEAFLAALRRFVSRRGLPTRIYSDRGTNFVGAKGVLKDFLSQQSTHEVIATNLSEDGIEWCLMPAKGPHMGGLWEAAVKSAKYHLTRIMGPYRTTVEEFLTIVCQVEAVLNSRPLCPFSPDPDDFSALTPGHFLISQPLNAVPEPDLTSLNTNRLSRWQRSQQILQHFWKRWSAEYLNHLQQRNKWQNNQPNINIGDLVLIKEDNLPPLKWKMGRVVKTHPGADNLVRVVTIKVINLIGKEMKPKPAEHKRPITKVVLLSPAED